MPLSKVYQHTLKSRFIKKFIKANDRRPTHTELSEGLAAEYKKYQSADLVGISSLDITKPRFHSVSSSEAENQNRHALFDDLKTISKRTDNLYQLLEDSFRGFQATAQRTKRSFNQLEARLDNLLLLNQKSDQFIYGIEETFDTQEFIDFTRTAASVEAGYVTLGRGNITPLNVDNFKFSASALSDKGFIAAQGSSDTSSLKEDDGIFWEYFVYTKYRQGRVSMVFDIELDSAAYVGEVKFTGSFAGVNHRTTLTVFYSLDGQTYTETPLVEQPLLKTEMSIPLGVDNVKKVRLVFSKRVADRVTTSHNQYVWVFGLDSIKIYTDLFSNANVSELFAGPYPVVNEEGDPVNFSKATLTACVGSGDDTSVNFYLSKDNSTWHSVNYHGDSLSVVSFEDASVGSSIDYIDSNLAAGKLIDTLASSYELNFGTDGIINAFIKEAFADKVPLDGMLLKRNLPDSTLPEIYKAPAGWYYNEITDEYSCTIYIGLAEGRTIDFGPYGIYVNDSLVKGKVHFQQGYSVIRTNSSNWREVVPGLTKIAELKAADPLYPYNHKLLIEGYSYVANFSNERVYSGVEEYFGWLLRYVAPEQFNSSRYSNDYTVYTVEAIAGNLHFKVKVDKKNAFWTQELYDSEWLVQRATDNNIYVKALLTSGKSNQTPMIEHFKVRVI